MNQVNLFVNALSTRAGKLALCAKVTGAVIATADSVMMFWFAESRIPAKATWQLMAASLGAGIMFILVYFVYLSFQRKQLPQS